MLSWIFWVFTLIIYIIIISFVFPFWFHIQKIYIKLWVKCFIPFCSTKHLKHGKISAANSQNSTLRLFHTKSLSSGIINVVRGCAIIRSLPIIVLWSFGSNRKLSKLNRETLHRKFANKSLVVMWRAISEEFRQICVLFRWCILFFEWLAKSSSACGKASWWCWLSPRILYRLRRYWRCVGRYS